MNYLAIGVAGIAAVIIAFVYYMAFGNRLRALGSGAGDSEKVPAWLLPVELLRALVVTVVVAGLVVNIGISGLGGSLLLGLALWVAFPVVLLTGSVIHEKVPWRLAAIHSGDWLLKLLVVAVIVGLWR